MRDASNTVHAVHAKRPAAELFGAGDVPDNAAAFFKAQKGRQVKVTVFRHPESGFFIL